MREILFRGKRLDNGEWVEGGTIIQLEVGTYILPSGANAMITKGNVATLTSEVYKVDPNTISQYTGLTDKNGKRIFEGDIIDLVWENEKCEHYQLLEVNPNSGGIEKINLPINKWSRDDYMHLDGEFILKNNIVIGNKWDNPELLESDSE